MPSTQNVSAYRFGIFEVDLRAAEVRKNGVKLKLQDQPYQVLVKLLEHHGEVVSREDLRSTLWPKDTFVDFETGLNTAIKRLRETIGDSADHPTFIETVPRRGYKFIASVAQTVCEDTRIPDFISPKDSPAGKIRLKWNWAAALLPALVISSVAFWYRPAHPPTVVNTVRITNDFKPKNPGNLPVTDGLYLYFIEGWPSTTGSRIAQLSVAGGETTWIATNLSQPAVIFGISPDRRELLVANGGGARLGESDVWVQPLPAGTAHRVGNISASSAAWYPDGLHILYAGGGTINLTNKDGTESRVLAKVPGGDARAFRFSPDGLRVRFWVTHGESNSIWEMDADGRNVHPLFPNWKQASYQCCGNWSPNGDYYYFQVGMGDEEGIWVLPEHPSIFSRAPAAPSRLTPGSLRFTTPLPSDDGKKLFVIGSQPRVELSRYDLHARRFDPYFSGLSAGPVDFSSDGKWIAYVSYPDMTLWRSRIDGTDKLQLTFPPVRVYEPRWSPDGSRIAFMDVQFNRPWKISLLPSSGGTPELLVQDSTDEADPTWTPDGDSIVFGKSAGYDKGISIYRLDLKSRKIFPIAGSKGIFSPRLSRDGRYISAVTEDGLKLMLFETATHRWSKVMEGKEVGCNEWSHDGKYVYLRQDLAGAGELVRVRIKDHVVEHILSFKDFPQPVDLFTAWIGLTPDDAPLLMRDRSVQELYALDLAFH